MKGVALILVALAASTQAGRLPLCSAVCLTNAIAATGCKASETQCICTSETFMPGVMECVEKSCVEADQASTLTIAESFCSAAGVHSQLKRDADPGREGEGMAWGRERFRGKGKEKGKGKEESKGKGWDKVESHDEGQSEGWKEGNFRGGSWRGGHFRWKGGKWQGWKGGKWGWWTGKPSPSQPAPPSETPPPSHPSSTEETTAWQAWSEQPSATQPPSPTQTEWETWSAPSPSTPSQPEHNHPGGEPPHRGPGGHHTPEPWHPYRPPPPVVTVI